jgi:ankyrin repeat protein
MFSRLFGGGKKRDAELHTAVQYADLAGIRQALDKGADVNALDPVNRESALHVAVKKENKAMVQLLLSKGAKPNVYSGENSTPLTIAVEIGDRALPIAELLLAGRADPSLASKAGIDVLGIAAATGANAILRHLLTFGVRPKILPNGLSLMHLAGKGGNAETVVLALEAGTTVNDLDGDDATPLHWAATHANNAALAALIKHGADTEKRNKQGQTPLDCATATRSSSTLKLLAKQEVTPAVITHKCDVDTDEPKATTQRTEIIRNMTLVEFGQKCYRNVRFQNAMAACAVQGTLPFDSIGAYIDAGEAGKLEILRVPNIGVTSVKGLDDAISAAIQQIMPIQAEAPVPEPQNLAEQLGTRYPGVFTPLLNEYVNTPLSDVTTYSRLKATILRVLSDERLAEVAVRRFKGETLAQIGESMGITRERVRQIESQIKPWVIETEEETAHVVEESDEPLPSGIRRSWFEMYSRLKDYHAKHATANVPNQWAEDPKLAAWVSSQRQKHKKGEVIPEQIKLLEELGFSWSLRERGTWEDRMIELVEFKKQHGHFDVPTTYMPAPKLRQFIASTRYQHRTGSLDNDRIKRLAEIGYTFDKDTNAFIEDTPDFIGSPITSDFTLSGRTLAITGRLESLTRDEAIRLAKLKGADVIDKFSGKVDLMVVGSEPGSKLADAQRKGIALIDEKQFITILR